MNILQMTFYTLIALGVLVTFHELGHFWVARRCGVKVLRFSIGFGKPLYTVAVITTYTIQAAQPNEAIFILIDTIYCTLIQTKMLW